MLKCVYSAIWIELTKSVISITNKTLIPTNYKVKLISPNTAFLLMKSTHTEGHLMSSKVTDSSISHTWKVLCLVLLLFVETGSLFRSQLCSPGCLSSTQILRLQLSAGIQSTWHHTKPWKILLLQHLGYCFSKQLGTVAWKTHGIIHLSCSGTNPWSILGDRRNSSLKLECLECIQNQTPMLTAQHSS